MRKITLLLSLSFFMLFGIGVVNAQLLFQENFDYATSSLLTDNGWNNHSGTNGFIDVTTGLTFDGYIASGIGGAANLDENGEDVNRTFTSKESGLIYASMIVQTSATNSQGYFFHFGQNPWTFTYSSRVWVNATGDALGIGGSTPTTWVTITPDTPTLVVVKYDIDTKESSLFVFNTYPTSEPATADATFTETSATTIGGIGLRQFNAAEKVIVDGIRVATTWDDVLTGEFPSNAAEILGFVLAEEIAPAMIDGETAQVTSTVAWDADLSALMPTITVSAGAQVTATIVPVVFDGITPVVYKVTAADLTEKLWNVLVLLGEEPPMTTIYDIQFTADPSGDSPLKDQMVSTKGVVATLDAYGFYLQDGAGGWNGIYVYHGSSPLVTPAVGDSVLVDGTIAEYNNLTEIGSPVVTIVNSGNSVKAPTVVSVADFKQEMYEGTLVTISDVTGISLVSNKNWKVANASDTLLVRNGIVDFTPVLFQKYTSITGFGGQFKADYQFFPRSVVDIVLVPMVTVTFNVDMTTPIGDASFVVGTDMVYVTGDFNGWDEPGKGESMMLTDADADNIYSGVMAMDINKGEIQYKYFKNAGWVGGEWEGEPNRKITIADVDYVIDPADIWGDKPVSVSDNKLSLVSLYPNPVKNQLTIANLEGVSKVTVSNVLGQSILTKNVTKSEMTINTSELRNGIYIVTLVSENGSTRSQRIVKQ